MSKIDQDYDRREMTFVRNRHKNMICDDKSFRDFITRNGDLRNGMSS